MSQAEASIIDQLKDVLRGYVAASPVNRALVRDPRVDWASLAKEEQRRRQARLLGCLDDATVALIANGQVSLPDLL